MATKQQIIGLYRSLLRESKKFHSYNYRNYALRRVRDTFKVNKALNDEILIKEQIAKGFNNLEVIKRQVLIGDLYRTDKLVIEHLNKA